jgi:hypothetical protein
MLSQSARTPALDSGPQQSGRIRNPALCRCHLPQGNVRVHSRLKPACFARGSESRVRVSSYLQSRDREEAVFGGRYQRPA